MKACPFCNEAIQDDAIKCRYCMEWINKAPSPNAAKPKLNSSLKSAPKDIAEKHIKLGEHHRSTGNHSAAIDSYVKAIEADPTKISDFYSLGIAYVYAEDKQQAINVYARLKTIAITLANKLLTSIDSMHSMAHYSTVKQIDKSTKSSGASLVSRNHIDTTPEVRPWVRYWARFIDTSIFALCILISFFVLCYVGAYLAVIGGFLTPPELIAIGERLSSYEWYVNWFVIMLPMLILFEAILLSTIGTTPGKWLCRINLRNNSDNSKLSFYSALTRSAKVWTMGMGLGIPFVLLFTNYASYRTLTKHNITSWDKNGSFSVKHQRIGALRTLLATLCIIIIFSISVVIDSYSESYSDDQKRTEVKQPPKNLYWEEIK